MRINKKLNPRANNQRSNQPNSPLIPFSFDRNQQLFSKPKVTPINTFQPTHSISQNNQANPFKTPIIQPSNYKVPTLPQTHQMPSSVHQIHHNQYQNQYCNNEVQSQFNDQSEPYYYFDQHQFNTMQSIDNYHRNFMSLVSNFANCIYNAINTNQQPKTDQYCCLKYQQPSPTIYEDITPNIQIVFKNQKIRQQEIKNNKNERRQRNEYTLNYSIECVRLDNGQVEKIRKGKVNVGFVDPHSSKTINILVRQITKCFEAIHHIIESVQINEVDYQISMILTCIIEPIILPSRLQYNIVKGLRITQRYVQIKWDQDIDVSKINFEDDIVIQDYNVELTQALMKNVHITFRGMDLQENSKQGFLQFMHQHSPALPLRKIIQFMYDEYLNVAIVSY